MNSQILDKKNCQDKILLFFENFPFIGTVLATSQKIDFFEKKKVRKFYFVFD